MSIYNFRVCVHVLTFVYLLKTQLTFPPGTKVREDVVTCSVCKPFCTFSAWVRLGLPLIWSLAAFSLPNNTSSKVKASNVAKAV